MAFLLVCRMLEKWKRYRNIHYALFMSYSDLLLKSGMSYLYVNRLRQLLLQVYESLSSPSAPNYIKQLFEAKNSTYGTRCILQLQLPSFNTIKYARNCIRYECPKMWKSLSSTFKLCNSKDSFIEALYMWNGPRCSCQSCILCKLQQI